MLTGRSPLELDGHPLDGLFCNGASSRDILREATDAGWGGVREGGEQMSCPDAVEEK